MLLSPSLGERDRHVREPALAPEPHYMVADRVVGDLQVVPRLWVQDSQPFPRLDAARQASARSEANRAAMSPATSPAMYARQDVE